MYKGKFLVVTVRRGTSKTSGNSYTALDISDGENTLPAMLDNEVTSIPQFGQWIEAEFRLSVYNRVPRITVTSYTDTTPPKAPAAPVAAA